MPIKKPWKIVSWGVHFQDLQKTCDGRHQHAPRAGRDTRVTQLYTFRIAQPVIETLNKRLMSLWKKRHVTSRAPKLQDWSLSPHPLLRKEGSSSEASLSKQFGRIIPAVHESKKKESNVQPFHDEPEPCASVYSLCHIVPISTAKAILVAPRSRSSSRRTVVTSTLRWQSVH